MSIANERSIESSRFWTFFSLALYILSANSAHTWRTRVSWAESLEIFTNSLQIFGKIYLLNKREKKNVLFIRERNPSNQTLLFVCEPLSLSSSRCVFAQEGKEKKAHLNQFNLVEEGFGTLLTLSLSLRLKLTKIQKLVQPSKFASIYFGEEI